MEKPKVDKPCTGSEDGAQLTRNRSFKSKQLVRSQAIRESHSPPRTSSPYPSSPVGDAKGDGKQARENGAKDDRERTEEKRQPVEIQISSSWDGDATEQRQRTQRWLGNRHHSDSSRDLLSNNPRLACVCGACECHRCRGQRRKHDCPVKQDSGIACSVDCPDCGYEYSNANGEEVREPGSFDDQRKSGSFDDQTSYCRCPPERTTRQDRPRNFSFTRSDSDIAEPSWVELVSFIQTTLNKNPRDRATMLKIEKDLHAFVNDAGRCVVRFPVMTSYGRMLVHRCAALFQLAHRLDTVHKNTVVVSKNGTSGGRIPCTSFRQWCTATFPRSPPRADDTSAKSILKRSCFGEETPPAANGSARSLEEREREYELVRRRIFSTGGAPDAEWPWLPAGPVRLLAPEPGRNKLIKVQSLESRGGEGGPRAPVAKSHSLDGYGNAHQPRLLSRHGDLASSSWRVSPSSSGYKTLSLRSTDSVTPSPTGCASPEGATGADARAPAGDACAAGAAGAAGAGGGAVVWCVTDMADVPPGALVIHPQTGRPLTHPDGSVYHFDPANPPVVRDDTLCLQNGAQDANNENRRGRLEKQHSFIDNESEYPSEEYDVKCCGDCPDQEICTKCPAETIPSPQSSKPNSIPASPAKRIEPTPETANQRPAYENPTNQKPPIENTTNQYSPSRRPNYNRYDNRLRYDQVSQVDQNNKPDVMANNSQPSDVTNQRPVVEVTANQRQVEQVSTNQSQDGGQRQYESQRVEQQRVYDQANVREVVPYVQNYTQYRSDEMTSPPQPAGAYAADASEHALIAQKMAPAPAPDPTMRPMSIAATVMYPAMHQAYPYVNPCRLEQPMQPMYQPLVQQMLPQVLQHMVPCEEQKHLAPSPHQDTTFRIDPSYPYATDFNAACGACADPSVLQHQQRSVSVGYGQVEMQPTVVPQPYPLHGMAPSAQPYPYQEAVQWQPVGPLVGGGVGVGPAQKLILPEAMYPLLCPNVYQPYNMLYPQVIPQPYPICPPVYPAVDKQPDAYRAFPHRQFKRASGSGSSRATPQTPDEAKRTPYEEKSREVARDAVSRDGGGLDISREAIRENQIDTSSPNHNTEIAVTIAQIKEQLALSTRAREPAGGGRARDDWRRRSCGGGLLGSCPAQPYVRLQGRPNEEAQINPAIYNSIRNMQAKQNYQHQQERRMYELGTQYRAADARYDARRARGDRAADAHDARARGDRAADAHDARARGAYRPELRQRGVGVPLPLRAPYVFRQVVGWWPDYMRGRRSADQHQQERRMYELGTQYRAADGRRARGDRAADAHDARARGAYRPELRQRGVGVPLPLRAPYVFRQVVGWWPDYMRGRRSADQHQQERRMYELGTQYRAADGRRARGDRAADAHDARARGAYRPELRQRGVGVPLPLRAPYVFRQVVGWWPDYMPGRRSADQHQQERRMYELGTQYRAADGRRARGDRAADAHDARARGAYRPELRQRGVGVPLPLRAPYVFRQVVGWWPDYMPGRRSADQHQQERRMYELGTQYRAADGRRARGDRAADAHDARVPRGAYRPELRQRGVGVPLPLRAPYVFRQVVGWWPDYTRGRRSADQHQQERRMYELGTQYRAADGRRARGDRAADAHDARVPRGAYRPELRQRGVGVPLPLRAPYVFRQVTPSTWSRRSPGMIPPIMNHPRRPHPDRNPRR